MTPEEERRGAELFAAGRSERQVADELGISASSAHRLRERLAAKDGDGGDGELELTPVRRAYGSDVILDHPELAEIEASGVEIDDEAERAVIAEVIETYAARADASRQALAKLEAERRELLDSDKDAAPLRPTIASVREDLADSEEAGQLARNRLAALEARIAERATRKELAQLKAQLDAAVAERDEVFSRSGDRQRAAVAAVRAAAEDFCAVVAEERATVDRVAVLSSAMTQRALQLGQPGPAVPPAASTRLAAQGGVGGELALTRAMHQAERGDVADVARHLGEANGWLPPGPPSAEEIERWQQFKADRERQAAELRNRADVGPQPIADHERVPVGTDHFGNPVDAHGNPLTLRNRMPHPADIWTSPGAFTTGGYGSSYRVGESPASY
jgi:hypothetical protein